MRRYILPVCFLFFLGTAFAQENANNGKIPVLIRCDDIGMCHGVNSAIREVLQTGMPVSCSVMVPCPWFTEAVEILKQYPNAAVGIHLTLNAEWKQYRWGPVAGPTVVPSLVDSLGNFFPSRSRLFANNPSMTEIETELRAQIEKALQAGLKVEYLDYHMGAAMQTPQTRAIVEKLAAEYGLGISRYFGEVDVEGGYSAPVDNKLDTLVEKMKALQPGGVKLLVFHIGQDNSEMGAMEDLNTFGLKEMSRHRQAELNALLHPFFRQALSDPRFRLVNYHTLIIENGLGSMKKPPSL